MRPTVAKTFTPVTTISERCFVFVRTIIRSCCFVYRRHRQHLHEESTFKMPGGLFMPYPVRAFFGFIFWALTSQSDTLAALAFTPVWFLGLGLGYLTLRRNPQHAAISAEHDAKVAREHAERRARLLA